MMELSLIITGFLAVAIFYLIYWLTMKKGYFEKLGLPNTNPPTVFGMIMESILSKKGFGELFVDYYKKCDGYRFVPFYQIFSPAIMIRDPELINQIFVKDFNYFEDRVPSSTDADDLFSLGLNVLPGDKWRNARHKLTPTFTSSKLKIMFGSIKQCSDEVANHIESKLDQDFEGRDLMLKYIINVIGNVGFGVHLNVLDENDKQGAEFFQKCTSFFEPSFLFIIKAMFAANPTIKKLFNLRLIDSDIETFFRRLTHDIIKHRKENDISRNDFLQLMLNQQKKELSNQLGSEKHSLEGEPIDAEEKELIDQLKISPLESNGAVKSEVFTEDFICTQTFLFVTGGSETTSTTLSYVLYELAANQELQKKVQDEVSSVLNSEEFSYEAIGKLNYMEQFLNETMRLHTPVVFLSRVCTRDYKIPRSEVILPKGSVITIPSGGLHMDPQYFDEPEKFNPDRFKDMDTIPKGVFLPFGSGPRNCIAMRLAMLEMKIVLARLLSNYTLVLSEKTKLPLKTMFNSMVPRVDGGVWLKFKRR